MANLRQFSAAEALNTEAAGVWDVQDVVEKSDNTSAHYDVSKYHNVVVDCDATICVLFDTGATTTVTDDNNLELPGGVTSIKIPKGLGSTIYFHWRRNGTSATVNTRVILT